jgi:transposase
MGEVEKVRHLAVLMGRGERTIHRWLSFYKKGGIECLLSEENPPGRPKKVALLQKELKDPVGFTSYKEIYF